MHDTPRARRLAYGITFLNIAVSIMIQWHFAELLGDRVLYMTFFPAILIAAYLGGFWPGFMATTLSALAVLFFLSNRFTRFELKASATRALSRFSS